MMGRSATAPAPQYDFAGEDGSKSLYSRGGGKYITMEDNDYASTVRPQSSTHSRRRRGSIDSGIGISPPSSASRASKKMLEAPPSAYKGPPTVITQAQTQASHKSRRSSSANRAPSRSHHSGRRSSSASRRDDAQTVLHIKEFRRVESFPANGGGGSQASTAKPSKQHNSLSESKSKSSRSPEKVPLPLSRAATWADGRDGRGGSSEASFATARSGAGGKTIMGLEKVQSEASRKDRDMTKSVVGKLRDVKRLDVGGSEVGPMDSVSQVSSSRGSRRSRR